METIRRGKKRRGVPHENNTDTSKWRYLFALRYTALMGPSYNLLFRLRLDFCKLNKAGLISEKRCDVVWGDVQ